MTSLTPALDVELSGRAPTIFGSVSIDLAGRELNLLDGAGFLSFGGRDYTGRDDTFGTLAAMESLTDGLGSEAPRVSITLLPASDAAALELASADMQGSLVQIHYGAVVRETGQVVPDPILLFLGEIDIPTLTAGANNRELEIVVASIFERFFTDDEGHRLSPGFHATVWPGELGFSFLTSVPQGVYWGVEAPPRGVSGGGGAAYGGAGGDRGGFSEMSYV